MKWAWRDGDRVTCYLIETIGGRGVRGESVEVLMVPNCGAAMAELASGYFDDLLKQRQGLDDSHFDRTSDIIEVCGVYDVPVRYRVWCEVRRHYRASNEPTGVGEANPCSP